MQIHACIRTYNYKLATCIFALISGNSLIYIATVNIVIATKNEYRNCFRTLLITSLCLMSNWEVVIFVQMLRLINTWYSYLLPDSFKVI